MRNDALQRVLVRGPNWIGDAVMCEPAVRALRSLFPRAEITLLVKPAVAELFAGHEAVDHVLVYEFRGKHAGLSGKWELAAMLRRHHFELAILFQNAFEAALLAWLAGVPRRYGYATDGRSLFLSDPVAVPDRLKLTHQVHYYWDLLKPFGLQGEPPAPRLSVTPSEEQAMAGRLASAGLSEDMMLIGVNPGSTYGAAKRWLPERFAETADRLSKFVNREHKRPTGVMVLGAAGEEGLGRNIAERISAPSLVLSGGTTIRELMAATKRCSVILTNDTGPMHIAAAFDVPIVAVFGPTDWRTTSPYGNRHALVRKPVDCAPCLLRECPIDHRCMTGVTVEEVYEAARQQLVITSESRKSENQSIDLKTFRPADLSTPLAGFTVFLDRDGTLNRDTGYVKSAAELELLPGVGEALARLERAGARLIVVTNQSGVARGFFSLRDLEAVHDRLRSELSHHGVALDAIYFCPHHPDDQCRCRKPGTAMIEKAVDEFGLDLGRAYVVGDQPRDIQLARKVGARSILVTTGPTSDNAMAVLRAEGSMPDHAAGSLNEAAEWILNDAAGKQHSAVSDQAGSEAARPGQVISPILKADR